MRKSYDNGSCVRYFRKPLLLFVVNRKTDNDDEDVCVNTRTAYRNENIKTRSPRTQLFNPINHGSGTHREVANHYRRLNKFYERVEYEWRV